MEFEFLKAGEAQSKIIDLVEWCDKLKWAVAWATENDIVEHLFKSVKKFDSVTFGIDFCGSDPKVLRRMIGIPNCGIFKSDNRSTFHPKIYYFENLNEARCIVGSSNFTQGGLGLNVEASIYVAGNRSHSVFKRLRKELKSYEADRYVVTHAWLKAYEPAYVRKLTSTAHPRPIPPDVSAQVLKPYGSPLIEMSWRQFSSRVRTEILMDRFVIDVRLETLRAAGALFEKVASFAELDEFERKGDRWHI